MTQDDLARKAHSEHAEPSEVPAGGAGADSGAADAVGIDPDDTAAVQNVSSQNDIAGVGTRPPDRAEASTPPAEVEQRERAADPAFTRNDEDAGAAHHNSRVSARDSGPDAQRAQADDSFQHLPRMAQNAPSHEDELAGIVAQTRADLGLGIAEARIGDILRQRLRDAGIEHDDDALERLTGRVLGGE